jgi:hypothetical protein
MSSYSWFYGLHKLHYIDVALCIYTYQRINEKVFGHYSLLSNFTFWHCSHISTRIKLALSWDFMRRNHLMRRKLRRHCLPCFPLTWSFNNNTIYSELIKTLLQAERHDELLLWNSNQGPSGFKPLLEVHANTHNKKQKGAINNGNPGTSNAKNKRKRQHRPHAAKGKDNGPRAKTILSPTKISPKLVRGVVATITQLRSVAPQST